MTKKKLRQEIDWKKIDRTADKLKSIVRQLITTELSDEQATEKMFLLFAVLANLEDGDKSETAYLAGELQQYAFTFSISHIAAFYEQDKKVLEQFADDTKPEFKPLDLSDSSIKDLSKRLSDLCVNPNIPPPLQDKIRGAVVEFYNEDINQDEINEFQNSPEYIEKILIGYSSQNEVAE